MIKAHMGKIYTIPEIMLWWSVGGCFRFQHVTMMTEDLYQHVLTASYIDLYEEDHCQKSHATKKKKKA